MTKSHVRRMGLALLLVLAGSQTTRAASGQIVLQGGSRGEITGDLAGMERSARPLESGTAVVVGRVAEADNRGPVAGAIVTLTLPGFTPLRALTDGQGRFAFRALPTGSYSLTASRPGFVDGALGRMRPGGTPQSLDLTDDQPTDAVDITLWRHAVISGMVLDENNEPLVGAPVKALRREFVGGQRTLTESGTDNTDDRGQYRLGSLEPGEYIIVLPITQRPSLDAMFRDMALTLPVGGGGGGGGGRAVLAMRVETTSSGSAPMVITSSDGSDVPSAGTDENSLPLTYQTEFFTGALTASEATAIGVSAGESRNSVDFRLTPVRSLSLTGTVIGPDGPTGNVQVDLIPADADDLVSPIETATASTDGTGHFEFSGIPEGQYILRARRTPRFGGGAGERISITRQSGGNQMAFVTREIVERSGFSAAPLPTEPTLWAEMSVGVNLRTLADVTVPLREGLTVGGHVTFQGSSEKPTAEVRSGIGISLEPADGRTESLTSVVRGRVDDTGTFTTQGVPAGKYVLRVSGAPQDWTLQSASFGGRDITETAVDLSDESAVGVVLSFTDRPSTIDGTVRDALGNADPTASVILFPADPALWLNTGSEPRRLTSVRVGQDGSFKTGAIPPGDYLVVAIADSAPRTWQDPAYLQPLSRMAQTVRVGAGDTQTITLTSLKGPA
ncbi:MAG: carboxypeptidase regulatory-like domain-containing protein [Acidobacteria bacterium]|nr:carboxypeptidase regulatory-like domain-containing protein [Acidobacteriota bacterium]